MLLISFVVFEKPWLSKHVISLDRMIEFHGNLSAFSSICAKTHSSIDQFIL